ncbi:MAG: response regulator [Veillonellales bacterium]
MTEKKNAVLFVDDEPHILSSIRRAAMDESFEAMFAGSGQEALEIFEKREISVIVTDMRMPGMDGLTLLKIIKEKYPQTVRIVLSGYTQLSQVLATVNQADIFQFIPKPWSMEEELLAGVRRGIKQFNLAAERDSLRDRLVQKNQAYRNIFRELEQRFAEEKQDLANLKKIYHWIFAFWKKNLELGSKYLEENKTAVSGYTDVIEAIMDNYLEVLPTAVEAKTVAKVIEEIVTASAGQISVQPGYNGDEKISGYASLLVMVCKSILTLIAPSPEGKVVCDVKIAAASGESGSPVIIVRTPLPPELSPLQQNRLKIGCSLLNEMGKAYRMGVKLEIAEEVKSIQIIWQTEASRREA